MKATKIILGSLTALMVTFSSCSKEEVAETNQSEESNTTQLTLDEFIDARETQDERDFLNSHDPIDNRELTKRFVFDSGDRAIIWIPTNTNFRWDCMICNGACSVGDPFPFPGDPFPFPFPWPTIETTSVSGVFDAGPTGLKLVIHPAPEELESAFTADGFFPIYSDIFLDNEYCDLVGLPHGSSIQAGVYTASTDIEGAYSSVTVDLLY
ncbi:MAG: hypothetical protein GQ574_07805 [Crocinitomix sp.]|nr:hypothetical protein [Crocinitomix sp.]